LGETGTASAHSPAGPGGRVSARDPEPGTGLSSGTDPADLPVPDRDHAGLVGRTADLEAVASTAATAIRTRRPSVVVISGEAGIGKSVLVRATLDDLAAAGAPRALTLSCDPRRTLP